MHYKVQPICMLYILKNTHSCLKTSIILTSVTWFVCTRCCPAADHSCLLRMTLQNQEEIMLLFLWWQQLLLNRCRWFICFWPSLSLCHSAGAVYPLISLLIHDSLCSTTDGYWLSWHVCFLFCRNRLQDQNCWITRKEDKTTDLVSQL